jgi:hypothetical protein
MAYTDFTFETIDKELGITCQPGEVFHNLQPLAVSAWLAESLKRAFDLSLISEKARSECIVSPLLLEVRELVGKTITILSGQRLDVDAARKLQGECDFLLARSPSLPRLQAPIMVIVEAKKLDIEAGLGQCIAQMVAAQLFNEQEKKATQGIFGCVTTGEIWQFLHLIGTTVTLHQPRMYLDNVGLLLAAFAEAVRTV